MHKDDFPGLQPGDIVEIYHPENEVLNDNGEIKVPRLMLMISKASIYPDNELQKPLNRETVNLEKSVAETFQLPNYRQFMIFFLFKLLCTEIVQTWGKKELHLKIALFGEYDRLSFETQKSCIEFETTEMSL